jgi:cardiolipin synthase (CMP-forming)
MFAEKSIKTSITLHGVLYFVGQAALLIVVSLSYRMGLPRLALFLGITAAYHGLLTGLLVMRSGDFYVESTGTRLPRVNLPNTLTLGRLSSLPSILYLIIQASRYPVMPVILPLMTLVFATDFLDGMIARRRHQITFVGRYLDSTSDYLMIVAVSIIFYYYGLVPLWFFILILGRLVLFAAGMAFLALKAGKSDPQATFLGKASIFALMVLYVMEVAGLLGVPWIGNDLVIRIVEYAVALIVIASLVDKAIFLRAKFAETARAGKAPTASGSV